MDTENLIDLNTEFMEDKEIQKMPNRNRINTKGFLLPKFYCVNTPDKL